MVTRAEAGRAIERSGATPVLCPDRCSCCKSNGFSLTQLDPLEELCGGLAAGNVVQQGTAAHGTFVLIGATFAPLADAMPLTAELEELIDKTISEIQELESQDLGASVPETPRSITKLLEERLFLLQESDSSQDLATFHLSSKILATPPEHCQDARAELRQNFSKARFKRHTSCFGTPSKRWCLGRPQHV